MSRSYKKTPIVKDNKKSRKFFKRQANKKVRRNLVVANGKQYRKCYNPYDIYDYISRCTFEEYKLFRYNDGKDEEEIYISWRRDFLNK